MGQIPRWHVRVVTNEPDVISETTPGEVAADRWWAGVVVALCGVASAAVYLYLTLQMSLLEFFPGPGITVDFETLDDQAVTIRDRDTMQQERVALSQVQGYLAQRLVGA